ncbi:unnamed protein product [Didymodactylos carnosus]|uniref:Carboxylesterase type B domain-containing protein n=1 Tax=Didymodactylos carnosus TaxID=1234261 RepID=A0A8S2F641_9BILA|nr:unnamed protein product [Didymodactylos carnosus]CAF4164601.1 unnamed protein product [Didymodactylos carnosus]
MNPNSRTLQCLLLVVHVAFLIAPKGTGTPKQSTCGAPYPDTRPTTDKKMFTHDNKKCFPTNADNTATFVADADVMTFHTKDSAHCAYLTLAALKGKTLEALIHETGVMLVDLPTFSDMKTVYKAAGLPIKKVVQFLSITGVQCYLSGRLRNGQTVQAPFGWTVNKPVESNHMVVLEVSKDATGTLSGRFLDFSYPAGQGRESTTWPVADRKTEIISTPSGRIDGIYNRYAQLFLGIPYAQPPLNKLRFQTPKSLKKWTNIFEANKLGHGCIENCTDPQSTSSAPLYDLSRLVNLTYVIIVTFNYRLGAFGFYFNIDKSPVGDWGLFHKVLIQSPTIGVPFRTKDNAQQFNNRFSKLLNCRSSSDELQCLQAQTCQEICQAQTTTADLTELNAFSIQKFRPWGPALGLSRFRLIYNSTQIFQEVIH